MPTDNESKKAAEGLIRNSGNDFHFKVASYLRSAGWMVIVSPYYVDGITDKPREIDIVATKYIPSSSEMMAERESVEIRLFIECKYVPEVSVFWFDSVDRDLRANKLVRDFSLQRDYSNASERDAVIQAVLPSHHYLSTNNDKVAKLTAMSKSPEQDSIYKALNQALSSMTFFSRNTLPGSNDRPLASHLLSYPMVLCNSFSKFYRADDTSSSIQRGFLLEMNFAHKLIPGGQGYFLVDILPFEEVEMEKFLDQLEGEARTLGYQSRQNNRATEISEDEDSEDIY